MGITVYINDHNKRARVHCEDCREVNKGGGGGRFGGYRYFDSYDETWDWINDKLEDYDVDDCYYCEPDENC